MKFVKICSRANGGSHFSDEFWTLSEGDFTPPSPKGYSVTETMDATGVLMMHHPPPGTRTNGIARLYLFLEPFLLAWSALKRAMETHGCFHPAISSWLPTCMARDTGWRKRTAGLMTFRSSC